MSRTDQQLISVLDIGTTKVACFVARPTETNELEIIGIGHQLSQGFRSGVVTDMRTAETSIVSAVHAAEQMAGQTINHVTVSLAGNHIMSHRLQVDVPLSAQAVSGRDLRRAQEHGRRQLKSSHPERDIVHAVPISYSLDEATGVQDPTGLYGHRLGADLHLVTASSGVLRNLTHCIARCQLDIAGFAVPAYASGKAVLSEDEKQLGVIVVDIGGATTSVGVFVEGKLLHTECIGVGGQHITRDIAKGLSTSIAHAERVKALHGAAIASPADSQEMIDVPVLGEEDEISEESQSISRSMLIGIIRPRVEEIFEMVRGKLEDSGLYRVAGRRIVLTGGGSQLMGVRDLAAQIFNRQVRLGKPISLQGMAESTSGPGFATATGLLLYAEEQAELQRRRAHHMPSGVRVGLGRVVDWVREYF